MLEVHFELVCLPTLCREREEGSIRLTLVDFKPELLQYAQLALR